MSNLRELQQRFKAHLLAGERSIGESVAGSGADDRDERLGIYAHAYRQRLREVLHEEFGGLRALAGESAFATLLDGYIDAHPSQHPNIRWLGASLPVWLLETSDKKQPDAFAAMAALDWALSTAFDAAASACVAASELAALMPEQWPSLRLHPGPALQRLTLQWNLDEIRQAIDNDEVPPALQQQPAFTIAVWRKDFGVRHRRLDADEAAALAAASEGLAFAELCGLLCEWHPVDAVAARAVYLLQRWIAAGWIAALSFDVSDDSA